MARMSLCIRWGLDHATFPEYRLAITGAVAAVILPTPIASRMLRVPDASRITPNPPPPGMRSGHDISLDVTLDAGLIIDNLTSQTHVVDIQRPDIHSAS